MVNLLCYDGIHMRKDKSLTVANLIIYVIYTCTIVLFYILKKADTRYHSVYEKELPRRHLMFVIISL